MDGESKNPDSPSDVELICRGGHFFWLLFFGPAQKSDPADRGGGRKPCCLPQALGATATRQPSQGGNNPSGNSNMDPGIRWDDGSGAGEAFGFG